MKTIILLLTIFLFVSIANAQWEKQKVDTKASLRGLSVVSEKIVWASGTGGTFLKTTDGGQNWTVGKVEGAEKLDFRDIEAFDADTAYLLSIGEGESSRIYKTTDGGKTWKMQFKNTNPKAFFDAFAFWDKKHGIAMSDPVDGKYVLLETSDGENWKPLATDKMPNAKEGEAAFAASGTCILTQGKKTVFLVSGGNDARVFRSTNRGLSWTVFSTPLTKGTPGSGVFSMAMYNKKRGAIVGGNYEKPDEITNNGAYTPDGGKLWVPMSGLTGYRSGVAFIDKYTVIAVGTNGTDISINGGGTWENHNLFNSAAKDLNAVASKGEDATWAVGANGLVVKYAFRRVIVSK